MIRKFKHKKGEFIATLPQYSVLAEVNQPGHLWTIPAQLLIGSEDWEEIIEKEKPFVLNNAVFKPGDKVCWDWASSNVDFFIIEKGWYENNTLNLKVKDDLHIFKGLENKNYNFRHYEEILFTTEDGVKINKDYSATLYTCMKNITCRGEQILHTNKYQWQNRFPKTTRLVFVDESKCRQYIEDNIPTYSKKQIREVLNKNLFRYLDMSSVIDGYKMRNCADIDNVLKELGI